MASNPKQLSTFNNHLKLPGWTSVKSRSRDEAKTKLPAHPSSLSLKISIRSGRAFIENHVDEELAAKGKTCSMMKVVLQLGSFRAQSKLFPAEVEPTLNECFTIPLSVLGYNLNFTSSRPTREQIQQQAKAVVNSRTPLNVLLLRHTAYGEVSTFGYAAVEWRWVLRNGIAVELVKLHNGTSVPCGLLELELQLAPRFSQEVSQQDRKDTNESDTSSSGSDDDDERSLIPRTTLRRQIEQDLQHSRQLEQQFRKYTKAWWLEFQYMRPEHQNRYVRLYAMTDNYSKQFVCTLLQPLRTDRALATPLHAARFVRLLSYRKDVSIDGERTERWYSPHAFLSKGVGDIEDHALLLCSLFLGFGLDAYVCTGLMYQRIDSAPHVANRPRHSIGFFVWVATKSPDNADHVHFWNPLTAEKFDVKQYLSQLQTARQAGTRFEYGVDHEFPFVAVHTIFNDSAFYANIQLNDSIESCPMDLSQETVWKAIPADVIQPLPHVPSFCLQRCSLNSYTAEVEIETTLKHLITEYRSKHHQTETCWSDDLTYVVSAALAPYEAERVTGQPFGNDEFQQAIQNSVPPGHVFKGLPFQFHHQQPNCMLFTMLENRGATSKTLKDALALVTPQSSEPASKSPLRFGVAVKVFTYAEEVAVTWVIVAVVHEPGVTASHAKHKRHSAKTT